MLEGQLQRLDLIQYLPPESDFETFRDDEHIKEKLKEWGLPAAKREFWYKDKHNQLLVTINGYQLYGKNDEFNTIVIEFPNGGQSCIHPAYLKEMQQSSFGKESMVQAVEKEVETENEVAKSNENQMAEDTLNVVQELIQEKIQETVQESIPDNPPQPKKEKAAKPKKEKKEKIELPADKVHFTAVVKQFAMTYNPFNEENDEVVVLENVQIIQEPAIPLGLAWCSHSKTLKKFELAIGDTLEFDGKVAAKKLAKGKDVPLEFEIDEAVLYKVNNPSKITKNS